MNRDQLLAAAGVARDAKHGRRRIGAHEAGVDQRPQQRDRAGRVAARIADPVGGEQLLALVLGQLGEAIGPAVGHAMRRRGVDHDRVAVTHRGNQLLGCRVGQAEHGDVGRLGDLGALAQVLAVGHRQLQQLDVRPVLEPVEDLQPGGAVLAVDENLGLVAGHGLLSRCWALKGWPTGEGRNGKPLRLSSGFTIRGVCYARAFSCRFCERRRRDRRRASEIMVGPIFHRGVPLSRCRRQARFDYSQSETSP